MSYTKLPDEKIAELYKNGTTVAAIQKRYNVTSGTIYRHLRAQGVKSDRKTSIPWTEKEDKQLIAAREKGLTGAELYERIPTREPAAIKSHVQRFRRLKLIR